MQKVKDVLKIVVMVILFPLVLHELGEYIKDIHDPDMYWGGKG